MNQFFNPIIKGLNTQHRTSAPVQRDLCNPKLNERIFDLTVVMTGNASQDLTLRALDQGRFVLDS